MSVVMLALIVATGFAVRGVWKAAAARLDQHGIHALTWRWFTGQPWHAQPLTDAGWLRPGRKALTRTGHASRFHHRPRWQRAGFRTCWTVAILAALYGLLAAPGVTVTALEAAMAAGLVLGCWRAWRRLQQRKHHRTWVDPLHLVLAPMVGYPQAIPPRSWLAVEPDRSKAVLALPPGFHAPPKELEAVASAAAVKLGLEDPEATWRLAGPEPTLTLARSEPPPSLVTLGELREAIDAAGEHELVLGFGKQRKLIKVSLAGDSPHIGLSMPSGDGKSTIAQLIAAQILYRGGVALIVDNKLFSHPWALHQMPNVRYAGTPEQIHNALCWLGAEIERRKTVALHSIDLQGNVRANVGPRLLIVGEELNVTTAKLRKYWKAIDGTGPSPALEVLDEVAFVGRQVRIHLLAVAQLLTARATGASGNDSSARENMGVRMLGGNSSAAAWKMLAPEVSMPPKTPHPGRVQVVTRRGVAECQIGFLNPQGRANTPEARELALAGTVTPVPAGMPAGLAESLRSIAGRQIENPGPDLYGSIKMPPAVNSPGDGGVTLREAAGTVVPYRLATLRTYRQNDPAFPPRIAKRGMDDLYDPQTLAAWAAARRDK